MDTNEEGGQLTDMRSGIAEGSDSENDNDISDYNVTMRMIILPLDD